ncbi:MAG: 2-oxoacid:acceptor oxidoreductase family protein [Clostridiales Family XIII bacterium]|jgi:2-oxoglutarate ferredoxin oxidoreductase subunit gamma|nr:2-oxoacid:acceptor oxidoreductase family protein [Clostridiales Family XIII bacterium]
MKNTLLVGGSGGQGVMSVGTMLAESAAENGKYATFMPVYGPEQRGGSARCTVIISDDEIMSPLPKKVKTLIAMNEQSYKKFINELEEGGILVMNSSRVTSTVAREDIRIVSLPADDIALETGNIRNANIVMIGAYLASTGAMDPAEFMKSLEHKFKNKPEVIEQNRKALDKGAEIGKQTS